MNTILMTISILCFLYSLFFLVADLTGNPPFFIKLSVRITGCIGVLFPIIYWLKLGGII